jgi:hypothetical protein
MRQYIVAMEYYADEHGKRISGQKIVYIAVEDTVTFEDVREHVVEMLNVFLGNVDKLLADNAFKTEFNQQTGRDPDRSEAFAVIAVDNAVSRTNVARIHRTDAWWWHLFIADELARQRSSEFEKAECELDEHFAEPSFEEILGESNSTTEENKSGTNFTVDAFISKDGKLLDGIPDYWMIQTGLI